MISEDIRFESQGNTLIGTIDYNADGDKPIVLMLHGSRPGNRKNGAYLTEALAAAGYSCLRFDYAGHGDSEGPPDLPFRHFVKNVLDAVPMLDRDKGLTVIGGSMSGAIAVMMTEHIPIKNLILLCPAAYRKSGDTAPYDERLDHHGMQKGDTDIPVFNLLKNYRGNLLHVIGSEDELIPDYVTDGYKSFCRNSQKSEFHILEGCPHFISKWLRENPSEKEKFIRKILDFLE